MNKKIIYPKALKKGDIVGVIAPSDTTLTLPSVKKISGYQYLEKKGINIVEHTQCLKDNFGLAGTIKERVEAIHSFFIDPKIKAIICFWGGNNSNQLLDNIDYGLIKKHPKIFIGYSDVSALLLAITKKTKIVTYHGPGIISFCKPKTPEVTWKYFEDVLISQNKKYLISPPKLYASDSYWTRNDNKRILKKNNGLKSFINGPVEGRIIASSLSSLLSLSGTEYFPKMKDSILFIESGEDWSFSLFDRMMTQCQQIGIFNQINGLIISKFMDDSKITEKHLVNILRRVINKKLPTFYNFDSGHTDPIITIPNGGYCKINKHGEIILIKA